MRVLVKKWGNSAAIRIPAAVMKAAHLKLDEAVEIHQEDSRIVIEPVDCKSYDLSQLLNGITEQNRHDEVDFGGPVGREAL